MQSVTTVIILFRLAYSLTDLVDCSNWNQCQFHTIEANHISCSSYIGCQSATIAAKGLDGVLYCGGSHGCNQATSLQSSGEIYCSGFRSCYAVTPIESEYLKCSGSYSCYCDGLKVVSLLGNEEVSCSGYRSCENCKISAGKKTLCDGAVSCKNNVISCKEDISCSGRQSCESATLNTLTNVECDGDYSCDKARITAKKANMKGNKSGKDAKINCEEVEATGERALDGAEIDSKGRKKIKVRLSGKAATKDTSVVCVDESECDVDCTDECPDLEVISMSGTFLKVTVTTTVTDPNTGVITTMTIECVTTDTDAGCPTMMTSNSDCIDESYHTYLIEKRNKIKLKRLSEIEKGNEENTEETYNIISPKPSKSVIKADINVCVNAYDCQNQTLEEPHQECYGYMSCERSHINQIIDVKTGSVGYIECYGDSACKNSHIYTDKGCIYCYGIDSCKFTSLLHGAEIQCSGKTSCAHSYGTVHAKQISCEGFGSCMSNTMEIVSNANCIAKSACSNSQIIAGSRIQCDGMFSCGHSDINSKFIKCTSQKSCYNSSIIAASKLLIDGSDAASYSYIMNTPNILADGYKSISYSLIDSQNLLYLNVQMNGDLSGFASKIECRSGSTCVIECVSNACRNLDLICHPGSTCESKPAICVSRKRAPVATIKGVYCPNVIYVKETDEQENNNPTKTESQLYFMSSLKTDLLNFKNNNIFYFYAFIICICTLISYILFYYHCETCDGYLKYQKDAKYHIIS